MLPLQKYHSGLYGNCYLFCIVLDVVGAWTLALDPVQWMYMNVQSSMCVLIRFILVSVYLHVHACMWVQEHIFVLWCMSV